MKNNQVYILILIIVFFLYHNMPDKRHDDVSEDFTIVRPYRYWNYPRYYKNYYLTNPYRHYYQLPFNRKNCRRLFPCKKD